MYWPTEPGEGTAVPWGPYRHRAPRNHVPEPFIPLLRQGDCLESWIDAAETPDTLPKSDHCVRNTTPAGSIVAMSWMASAPDIALTKRVKHSACRHDAMRETALEMIKTFMYMYMYTKHHGRGRKNLKH